MEAHGGRIRAESGGTGLGARFTFTFPAAGPAYAEAAPRGARPHRPKEEETRILVVDDDPQALRYVRDALAGAGYKPIVTGDPGGLADIILAERPGLVLLDLMFPQTDGIELMEQVPELGDLPVIFISLRRDRPRQRARTWRGHYISSRSATDSLAVRARPDPREPRLRCGDLRSPGGQRVGARAPCSQEFTCSDPVATRTGRDHRDLPGRVWSGRDPSEPPPSTVVKKPPSSATAADRPHLTGGGWARAAPRTDGVGAQPGSARDGPAQRPPAIFLGDRGETMGLEIELPTSRYQAPNATAIEAKLPKSNRVYDSLAVAGG